MCSSPSIEKRKSIAGGSPEIGSSQTGLAGNDGRSGKSNSGTGDTGRLLGGCRFGGDKSGNEATGMKSGATSALLR